MDQKQLQDYLDQLNAAIDKSGAPDADKQQLNELIDTIEQQLDDPLLAEDSDNLADQVDVLVAQFESEHPTIAGILNNIMMTLSSMGV